MYKEKGTPLTRPPSCIESSTVSHQSHASPNVGYLCVKEKVGHAIERLQKEGYGGLEGWAQP